MTDVAMKVKVGIAACAVAASASLVPITTAGAAPVLTPAPLAPVQVTYAPEAPIFGSGRPFDLLALFNRGLPSAPSTESLITTVTTTKSSPGIHTFVKLFLAKVFAILSLHCYHGVM